MCSIRVALVGGRYSNVWIDWAKSVKVEVVEYKETTKLSKTLTSSNKSVRGVSIRLHNAVVSSGLVAHLRYADFFTVPGKKKIRSHTLSGHENQAENMFLQEKWQCIYRELKYMYISSFCLSKCYP